MDTSSSETLPSLIEQSCKVIAEFQQPSGAYPASPNFDVYHYSWFRDGAFIADGMSRAGQIDSAERFFAWCSEIVVQRRDHILNGGKLDARYTYEGKESTDEWETFQLDGYGTWLWAMQGHAARHGRLLDPYQEAAGLTQHYLATHWQEPCADWWEERQGTHAASLACMYAGLQAYEHPEAAAVRAAIDMSSERTDSSLLVCPLFNAVDDEAFAPVLDHIESELESEAGGVYRYREDDYYGGGEWPVLTSMLGWYYLKLGRTDEARDKLSWVKAHIGANGWLPEQSQDQLLHPENYEPWVKRWGKPANPLLWSHAMFLTLATGLQAGETN
ncbi:MAG TPA: glycoside hydrolase family 15 protein [Verrucomicrobiae bacterium]|nr:glycoside hydrolase family 15 protein [Verrucomicrobiae bacterium]